MRRAIGCVGLILACPVLSAAQTRGCPDLDPTWMELRVCEEVERTGYVRPSSSAYRNLEDDIIRWLPKKDGQVYTPYTCTLFPIKADGTADTDIEHIVAAAEAYDSGLPTAQFRAFAGDLKNLTIAVPRVNRRKTHFDAGEWQPDLNQGWYAATVIAVKQAHNLSVDARERRALIDMLASETSRAVTCGPTSVPALPFLTEFLDRWFPF